MEVANLQVVVSSEVADALAGLRSVQREVKDAASVSAVEMKRMSDAAKATSDLTVRELSRINEIMGQLKLSEKARAEVSNAAFQGNALVVDKEIGAIIASLEKMGEISDETRTEIANALKGVDAKLLHSGNVTATETKKVEGFLGKWKMGWVAVSAAAVGSLYSIIKISPLLGGYISEAFSAIGAFLDEIVFMLAPVIEPLLDLLWKFVDWFVALPPSVKYTIAGLTGLLLAAAALIPIFTMLNFAIGGMEKIIDLLIPVIDEFEIFGISIGPMLKDLIDSFVGLGIAGGVLAVAMKLLSIIFKGDFAAGAGGISGIIGTIFTKIKELTGIDLGGIKDKIKGIFDFTDIAGGLTKGISTLISTIDLSGLISGFTAKLKEIDWLKFIDLSGIISGAVAAITSIDWGPIKETIKTKAGEIWEIVKGLLPEKVRNLLETIAAIITGEKSALDLIVQNAVRVIDWLAAAKLAAEMFMQQLTGTTKTESDKVPWGTLIFAGIGLPILPIPKLLLIGGMLIATITGAIRGGFSSIFSAGSELVSTFIGGIGDIGSRIWSHIRASLSTVESNLWSWVSGLTGFSPTLLELGRQIPLSLVRGAHEVALDARTFAPVVAPAVTPSAYPGTFASFAVARPPIPTEINISMPVTITAAIRSETDLRDIARKLKEELKRELKDYVRYA